LDRTGTSKLNRRVGAKARLAALTLLAVLIVFNAERTRRIGRRVEQAHERHARYYDAIEACVGPRLKDPNFTFGIRNPPRRLDILLGLSRGYPGGESPSQVFSVSDALYGHRYTPFLPSVWLDFGTGSPPSSR